MNQAEIKSKDYYTTSDLALATAVALFYSLDSLDFQNPRKANFIFKKESGLDILIETYWKGELTVEPQAYFNQLKSLKTRLYSGGNNVN